MLRSSTKTKNILHIRRNALPDFHHLVPYLLLYQKAILLGRPRRGSVKYKIRLVHRRKKASSEAYCRISHELMNAPGGVAVSSAQIKLMAPLEVGQPMFRMKNLRSGEHRIVEVQQTKLTCRPPPASRPV
jgi:hypothetical protein